MEYKFNERLEVEWLDVVDDPDWVEFKEAGKIPAETYCRSIGYFLKQNDRFLWISPTIGRKRKGSRSVIIIPKGTIQKVRSLAVKRTKSKE